MDSFVLVITTIFDWLTKTTLHASVIVLIVIAVRYLLSKRLAPRWHYYLWLLVIARMLMPIAPQSAFSIFNLIPAATEQSTEAEPEPVVSQVPQTSPEAAAIETSYTPQPPIETTPVETVAATEQAPAAPVPIEPIAASADPVQSEPIDYIGMIPLVWLAGVVALAAYVLLGNIQLSRIVSQQRPVTDSDILNLLEDCKSQMNLHTYLTVVETSKVSSPALFGFLRPRLLLPEGLLEKLTPAQLRHVFLHELAHLKRGDIYFGWLVALLQTIHWFNPLVWLAFHKMRADRELACDQLALTAIQNEEPNEYGKTIVSLLENFSTPSYNPGLAGILEDRSQLKRRITMIAKHKKGSYRFSTLAAIVIAILCAVALTSAKDTTTLDEKKASANTFSDLLIKGQFKEAVKNFDRTMKKALPARKLRKAWNETTANAGPFEKKLGTRTEKYLFSDIIYVTCQFQQGPLDIKVVYDKNKKISGLWLVPVPQKVLDEYGNQANISPAIISNTVILPPHQVLDLATGETINPLKAFKNLKGGDAEFIKAFDSYGKGDITCDRGSSLIGCLRGTKCLTKPIRHEHGMDVFMFKTKDMPVELTVVTKEGLTYKVTILKIEEQGCQIKYTLQDSDQARANVSYDHYIGQYANVRNPGNAVIEITKQGSVFIIKHLDGPSFAAQESSESLKYTDGGGEELLIAFDRSTKKYQLYMIDKDGQKQTKPEWEMIKLPANNNKQKTPDESITIDPDEKKNLIKAASIYDKMKPAQACEIMLNLVKNNQLDYAVKIIYYMSERTSSNLLAEISKYEPSLAATISQKLIQIEEKQKTPNTIPTSINATQKSNNIANLENGITVEVASIRKHIGEDRQSWKIDGTKLDKPLYESTGSVLKSQEGYTHYEFAARIMGPSGLSIKWDVPGGRNGSYTGNPLDDNGNRIGDIYVYTVNAKDTDTSATVNIGVSLKPWRTRATHSTDKNEQIYDAEIASVAFGRPYEKDSETLLPFMKTLKTETPYAMRVIAITNTGREVVGGVSGSGSNSIHSSTYYFKTPLADIKEFRFQSRLYEFVRFENVSLRPGGKTEPKITIEKHTMDTSKMSAGERRQYLIEQAQAKRAFKSDMLKKYADKLLHPIAVDTKKDFLAGDSIEITELFGTSDKLQPGHNYIVKGKYNLASRETASLRLYATNGETACDNWEQLHKGQGEFTRIFQYYQEGWLHLSFYPARGGGGSLGNLYFNHKEGLVPDISKLKGTKPTEKASSKPSYIPPYSRINEDGQIIDKVDYPFVNDPAIIGKWISVDFVDEISQFDPAKKKWAGDLFLASQTFRKDGKVECVLNKEGGQVTCTDKWTKCLVMDENTASKYTIKTIDGSEYLFVEWKSGDYRFRHTKPSLYVLKKAH